MLSEGAPARIASATSERKRILTGIRPTGPLHLGHYAGALENWVKLQSEYDCYFLIADYQVSDYANDLPRVRNAVWEVALDWLAAGLDPDSGSFVVESLVPEHAATTPTIGPIIMPLAYICTTRRKSGGRCIGLTTATRWAQCKRSRLVRLQGLSAHFMRRITLKVGLLRCEFSGAAWMKIMLTGNRHFPPIEVTPGGPIGRWIHTSLNSDCINIRAL